MSKLVENSKSTLKKFHQPRTCELHAGICTLELCAFMSEWDKKNQNCHHFQPFKYPSIHHIRPYL